MAPDRRAGRAVMALHPSSAYTVGPAWAVLMAEAGLSPALVLRRAGLPDDLFAREGATLAPAAYFRLWRALDDEAGDPLLPLRLVRAISAESVDVPIVAALCSDTLRDAVERIAQFKALIGPMRLQVTCDAYTLTVSPVWPRLPEPPAVLVTTELLFWVALARLGTQHPVRAMAMTLPEAERRSALTEYVGTRVTRGPAAVTFARDDATRPFLTANARRWAHVEPELRRRLSAVHADARTVDHVRAVLAERLPAGQATIATVARDLAVSRRSLQRQLRDEGRTFRAVLNEVREALARHYLAQSRLPTAQIAFLLGFDDPNSFYRAFRRWTGHTPEAVRATAFPDASRSTGYHGRTLL